MDKHRKQHGFSLIEVLIVCAISLTLMTAMAIQFFNTNKSLKFFESENEQTNLILEFNSAVKRLDKCNNSFANATIDPNVDSPVDLLTQPAFTSSDLGKIFTNVSASGIWNLAKLEIVRRTNKQNGSPNNGPTYEMEIAMVIQRDINRSFGAAQLRKVVSYVFLQTSGNLVVAPYPCQSMPQMYSCPTLYSNSCGDMSACQSTCVGQIQTQPTCIVRGFNGVGSSVACTALPILPPQEYTCPTIMSNSCGDTSVCQSMCVGQDSLNSSCTYHNFNGTPSTAACTPK